MTNEEINLNSRMNATTSQRQNSKYSFNLNGTHDEKEYSTRDIRNEYYIKRSTPILFSTNRGLHLRVMTTSNTTPTPNTTTLTSTKTSNLSTMNSIYNIKFCDLERWSTNRANTITLEDTFTVPKPAVASGTLVSKSLKLLPSRNTLSADFKGYSQLDVE